MEAICMAAEMRVGGAYAHSIVAIDTMHRAADKTEPEAVAGAVSATGRLALQRWIGVAGPNPAAGSAVR